MPVFAYKAKKGPHEVVEGEVEASNENEVIKLLDGLSLAPVSIQLKKEKILAEKKPQRSPNTRGIRRRLINDFIRGLANLVKGNVPILKSLNLLEKQASGPLRAVIAEMVSLVQQGVPLSQAMERQQGVFTKLLIGMVRGGESAGLLGAMLEKTADHEEKMEELRQKIRGAMAYPIFVLVIGAITIFVLLAYVMPKLMETYLANQQQLPWPTELTLGVGQFLSTNWYWLFGTFLLFYAIFIRRGIGQGAWDVLQLKIPFIRPLVLRNSVIDFSRTLGLLVAHGVPLVKGVPLAAETVGNKVMRERLKKVEEQLIKRGSSLAAALKEVPDYPPMAVALVSVGEESGDIATALDHVARQYERDVEAWLKAATTLIEPVMILLVGGIIGFVVFAMLMPIFQMDVLVQ